MNPEEYGNAAFELSQAKRERDAARKSAEIAWIIAGFLAAVLICLIFAEKY